MGWFNAKEEQKNYYSEEYDNWFKKMEEKNNEDSLKRKRELEERISKFVTETPIVYDRRKELDAISELKYLIKLEKKNGYIISFRELSRSSYLGTYNTACEVTVKWKPNNIEEIIVVDRLVFEYEVPELDRIIAIDKSARRCIESLKQTLDS